MNYFERHKRFEDWALDLERRLALFLFELKEPLIIIPPPNTVLVDPPEEKLTVEVREVGDKWWAVLRNGEEIATFYGHDAQKRADKLANDLLNHPY